MVNKITWWTVESGNVIGIKACTMIKTIKFMQSYPGGLYEEKRTISDELLV